MFIFGQMDAGEAKPEKSKTITGTLIIEFSGLNKNKGKVLAGLYNDSKKFPLLDCLSSRYLTAPIEWQ